MAIAARHRGRYCWYMARKEALSKRMFLKLLMAMIDQQLSGSVGEYNDTSMRCMILKLLKPERRGSVIVPQHKSGFAEYAL